MCYFKTCFLIIFFFVFFQFSVFSQTVNIQGSGNVQVKNGKVKASNNVVVGDGQYTTKSFNLSKVNSIEHEISGNLEIYYSDNCSVEISADNNILGLFNVSAPGGKLNIKSTKSYVSNFQVSIRIYTNTLSSIALESSGNINAYDINSKKLKIVLNGSGNIYCSGKVTDLNILLEGSGNISCKDLIADKAEITHQGSGNINVYSHSYLKINHHGSGDIYFWGNPKTYIDNDGMGDIYSN